jgi:hypothetical protein
MISFLVVPYARNAQLLTDYQYTYVKTPVSTDLKEKDPDVPFEIKFSVFDHPGIYQRKIVQPEPKLTGSGYNDFSGKHPNKIRSVFPAEFRNTTTNR